MGAPSLDSIQVIIPALDDEETIGAVVGELRALGLKRIRVVNNGSSDDTVAEAKSAGAEVWSEPKRGYGQACWTGYQTLEDEVEWVLFADADGSDELKDVYGWWRRRRAGQISYWVIAGPGRRAGRC
ncbi:MAG: glycosyltransferase [Candidatus Synoicihabitans palmerolidicus]|nr:glycosyltransferase [Candidatus Synoicihabitans palmerolidicus]